MTVGFLLSGNFYLFCPHHLERTVNSHVQFLPLPLHPVLRRVRPNCRIRGENPVHRPRGVRSQLPPGDGGGGQVDVCGGRVAGHAVG